MMILYICICIYYKRQWQSKEYFKVTYGQGYIQSPYVLLFIVCICVFILSPVLLLLRFFSLVFLMLFVQFISKGIKCLFVSSLNLLRVKIKSWSWKRFFLLHEAIKAMPFGCSSFTKANKRLAYVAVRVHSFQLTVHIKRHRSQRGLSNCVSTIAREL